MYKKQWSNIGIVNKLLGVHQRPSKRHIHYKWSVGTSSKNEDESQFKIHCVRIWSVNFRKGHGNQTERTQKIPGFFDNAWHVSYNNYVYGSDQQMVQRCWIKRSCHTIGFTGWRLCGQALSGKMFKRGVRVYKLTYEALFSLFLDAMEDFNKDDSRNRSFIEDGKTRA